ncbi:ABC transporter permease [Pseudogemmobacter humi]|uniref:Putrescine transport system permease protein PotH n=1 Tax=Pseudogemmobacter humi TaxID=2483812 RepID=A0A3P5WTE5_9RHOB|nr:ABC transporter permease [Pseudogemmobacter humi]VDC24898.1 Putrescine transport system permease protein PotH [Pseudogemmobacter humi]
MAALTLRTSGWLLVLPLLGLVVVMFAGPLFNIFWLSFTDPGPGLSNYTALAERESLRRLLWVTLRICALTTLFSVVLGYCIAYAMTHAGEGARQKMLLLLLISFWISVLVRTFAWIMILGRNGLLNNGLMSAGLISAPLPFVRNELGVLIGMVHYMIPYAVLPLLGAMRAIDGRVMAASRNLGASPAQTFWRIWLPLTKPGVIAASLLVFILSLGFYVTPAILGGGKVLMVAEYISVQVLITLKWGTAAMLAVLILVSVLALLALMSRFMKLSAALGGRA